MLKTYWCVESRFDDYGRKKIKITHSNLPNKPEDSHEELPSYDIYLDWFSSEESAQAYVQELR